MEWPPTVGRERAISSDWFILLRRIVNRRRPDVFQSDESILEEFRLTSPVETVRKRFLKHYGHALRTSQREKSAGVKLSPLSMAVAWKGEHGLRCTARHGVVRETCVLRRGMANLCTSLSYCVRLLGIRNGDVGDLIALAQKKESWRNLTESLTF